jgi:hypothetical protein
MTTIIKTEALNLDVGSPAKVAAVLRAAAEAYDHSATELGCSWQDKHAGRVWARIARELDRAALRVEQILNQEGW